MDERRKKMTERENTKKNGMTKQEAFKQGKMEKKEKEWNGLRNGVPYLFVAPATVLLVIFVFYPLVNLIYLGFLIIITSGGRNLSDLRITECCFL